MQPDQNRLALDLSAAIKPEETRMANEVKAALERMKAMRKLEQERNQLI